MKPVRLAEHIAIHGARPRTPAEYVARLMRRVEVTPAGCWEFTGQRDPKGYGRFSFQGGGRKLLAHRVAWTLRFGDPGDLCVLHHCDNPPCIRPSHLFLGTVADNNADMDAKGRRNNPGLPGEKHHQAKLTEHDVRTIRASSGPRKELALRFGVSISRITAIRSRKSWRHVA